VLRNVRAAVPKLESAAEETGREVNPVVSAKREFLKRVPSNGHFVKDT